METTNNNGYMKGFIPYAVAAAVMSLCGGFTASVPTAIATAWNADASLTFITLAYSLAAAAMAPIMGKLGGALGRRKVLLASLGLYTIGQLLIAICPANIPMLLVFRFMVGIGAAGIAPSIMAYIMVEFPPEKIAFGFTLYLALASGMVVFGPTIGSFIMSAVGTPDAWRTVMWVCVVLCVISVILCFVMAKDNPNIPKGSMQGFDWGGALFVLLMFGAIVCIPTFGQQSGWAAVTTLASIGVAVVSLIILVMVEKKAASPIMSGKFIARKNFILPVVVLFLTQGLMTACLTEIIRFGYAVNKTAIASYAMSIEYVGMAVGTIVMGPQADKKEPRVVAAIALVFVAIGSAIMMLINENAGVLQMGGVQLGEAPAGYGGEADAGRGRALPAGRQAAKSRKGAREMKYPNIEAERARAGLSKKAVAEHIGVNVRTYQNWQAGRSCIPSDKLCALCDLLNCSADYLLGRVDGRGHS